MRIPALTGGNVNNLLAGILGARPVVIARAGYKEYTTPFVPGDNTLLKLTVTAIDLKPTLVVRRVMWGTATTSGAGSFSINENYAVTSPTAVTTGSFGILVASSSTSQTSFWRHEMLCTVYTAGVATAGSVAAGSTTATAVSPTLPPNRGMYVNLLCNSVSNSNLVTTNLNTDGLQVGPNPPQSSLSVSASFAYTLGLTNVELFGAYAELL